MDNQNTAIGSEYAAPPTRRRHVRLPITLPVRYRLNGSDLPLTGKTQNISDSGLLLVTADPLPSGSAVSLQLLCNDTKVGLEGEVIWSRPVGPERAQSGIQFRLPSSEGFATRLFIQESHRRPAGESPDGTRPATTALSTRNGRRAGYAAGDR